MMDWYYDQISQTAPITEESYEKLRSKNFTSGRPIALGDYVLFGLLLKDGHPNEVIMFHLDELNTVYKVTADKIIGFLPRIKEI